MIWNILRDTKLLFTSDEEGLMAIFEISDWEINLWKEKSVVLSGRLTGR